MSAILYARFTGLIYLLVIISGFFSLMYVPSQLFVWNQPEVTANNIIANQGLYRWGIFLGVICYLSFGVLGVMFYRLFKSVDQALASILMILVLLSVPVAMMNLLNHLAVLQLLSGHSYLSVFPKNQLFSQAMFFLGLFDSGLIIVKFFWGAWLLPLGALILKSNCFPKPLGWLLIVGCFSYVFQALASLLFPSLPSPPWLAFPAALAEIGVCLFLLFRGVKSLD